MDASPEIRVTLSKDLLNHLRRVSQAQHVPLQWLVAGLVCDTFQHEDPASEKAMSPESLVAAH